jgi:hypothetical protein
VNFVKHIFFFVRISNNLSIFRHFLIVLLSIYLAGCSDGVSLPVMNGLTLAGHFMCPVVCYAHKMCVEPL